MEQEVQQQFNEENAVPLSTQIGQEEQIKRQIESLKALLPRKPRVPKKLPVAVSLDEFSELVKHTPQKHHKIAFLLGFGAGMRVSEIVNLEPRHVVMNEGKILIEQGKGSKDRTVPIPDGFKKEFLNLLPLKCGVRALEKAFKRSCERADLLKIKPSLHFHSLRHGFATHAVSSKIPIHHIRTLMGHSNISTTNIYLEANPQEALKSYKEFF